MATGLCLAWAIGAAGTWVGRAAGPLVGGVALIVVLWGALYWPTGRPGRLLGAVLQASASGGVAAALVVGWFSPLFEAWLGPVWLATAGLRLTLAAMCGVTLGLALVRRADDPALPFPEAAALAEVIGLPTLGRSWRILLVPGFLSGAARAGLALGWWPGVALAAGDGRGWAGLAGLMVAPGLVGLGMLVGWETVAALAAGSLAVGAMILPAALEMGPVKVVAPALRAAGEAGGLELQASYGPLIGLGAGAVLAAFSLWEGLPVAWKAWRTGRWRRGLDLRSGALPALAAVLLGGLALGGPAVTGSLPGILLFLAAGALSAALGVAAVAHLGNLPLPVLGLPALAMAGPALAAGLGAGRIAGLDGRAASVLTAGALTLAAALFAADYLQTVRVNLLLEAAWPVYPVKLTSCLAGLSGAAWAASTLTATGAFPPPAEAGLVSRVALAGLTGRLPLGFLVSGAGLGALSRLLVRPAWTVALGALLPLPAALTLLLGGLAARRCPESARLVGFGLLLGDLVVQGGILLLKAWRLVPLGVGPGEKSLVVATGGGGRVAGLLVLAGLALFAIVLARRSGGAAAMGAEGNKPRTAAGNAASPG
ncbi:MAG: hypothetical protein QME79_06075 [Bacillota bacterium]|nr:hypothetical protein [Bacillota bacterium]